MEDWLSEPLPEVSLRSTLPLIFLSALLVATIGAGGALVASARPAAAEGQDAAEIWKEARRRYRVENAIQSVRMVLVAKNGSERVRDMEMRIRRTGEITYSYTRFNSPADVAGTQLVLVDNPGQADEQLLYLPAMERVNRVAGSARNRSFMGSDFRFEDFELDDGAGDVHVMKEETADEWVIETTSGGGSDWTRMVSRISKADAVLRHVQYYDKKDELARELVVEKVETHDGVPVPMLSVMKDAKRGSSTRMEVEKVQVNVPAEDLPDDMFTAAYLEQNG